MSRFPADKATAHWQAAPHLCIIAPRPFGTGVLRSFPDYAAIQRGLGVLRGAVRTEICGPRSLRGLERALSKAQNGVDILHYDGHAERRDGATLYAFENEEDCCRQDVSCSELAAVLGRRNQPKRRLLLVLSACQGFPSSSELEQLAGANISAVVGFSQEIDSRDSDGFVDRLYSELSLQRSLREAVDAAARLRKIGALVEWLDTGAGSWNPLHGLTAMPATGQADNVIGEPHRVLPVAREIGLDARRQWNALEAATRALLAPSSSRPVCTLVAADTAEAKLVGRNAARLAAWRFTRAAYVDLPPGPCELSRDALATSLLSQFGSSIPASEDARLQAARLLAASASEPALIVVDAIESDRNLSQLALRFLLDDVGSSSRVLLLSQRYVTGSDPIAISSPIGSIRSVGDAAPSSVGDPLAASAAAPGLEPAMPVLTGAESTASEWALMLEAQDLPACLDSCSPPVRCLAQALSALPDPITMQDIDIVAFAVMPADEQLMQTTIGSSPFGFDELLACGVLSRRSDTEFDLHRAVRERFVGHSNTTELQLGALRALCDHHGLQHMAGAIVAWGHRTAAAGLLFDRAEEVAELVERTLRVVAPIWRATDRHAELGRAYKVMSRALEFARKPVASAKAALDAADSYLAAGEFRVAEDRALKAISMLGMIAGDDDRNLIRMNAHQVLGLSYCRRGQIGKGLDFFETCRSICEDARDTAVSVHTRLRWRGHLSEILVFESDAHRELGKWTDAHRELGKCTDASSCLLAALRAARGGTGDRPSANLRAWAIAVERLGYLSRLRGAFRQAERRYLLAQAILAESGPDRLPLLAKSLGDVHSYWGNDGKAAGFYMQAENLAHRAKNHGMRAFVLARRARESARCGNHDDAYRSITTVDLQLSLENDYSRYRRIQILLDLSEACGLIGEGERAEGLVEDAKVALGPGPSSILHADVLRTQALVQKGRCKSEASTSAAEWLETAWHFRRAALQYHHGEALWRMWRCRIHAADCELQAGRLEAAARLYVAGARAFARMGDRLREARCWDKASQVSGLLGDDAAAALSSQRALEAACYAGSEQVRLSSRMPSFIDQAPSERAPLAGPKRREP